LVSYAGPLKANVVRIPPVVNLFTLNKYSGKKHRAYFLTLVLLLMEEEIFWSILRDGSILLYTLETLQNS
jgi:hypothetical protein